MKLEHLYLFEKRFLGREKEAEIKPLSIRTSGILNRWGAGILGHG